LIRCQTLCEDQSVASTLPRNSVSQISTLPLSFAEDVRAYAAAGLDGLGVWETKLPEGGDAEALELFEASGLASASAIPVHPSVLPLPLLGGPVDPAERAPGTRRLRQRMGRSARHLTQVFLDPRNPIPQCPTIPVAIFRRHTMKESR
jgi:hypothetical protein